MSTTTVRLASGSVLGGTLLIAGSCIGAGMLALPILTGMAGFFPSLAMLLVAWAFMTFTALLLVESTGWFFGQVNLLSMAEQALGRAGRFVAWGSYLFLFYSLLVAYIAASGSVFSAILQSFFSIPLPPHAGSLFFTALFGGIVYLGTRPVDLLNRVLMVGLIITYLGMVGLGLPRIDPHLLQYVDLSAMLLPLPVLVVSFGFQNMIPSLTAYLGGDLARVRKTILFGSLLTLAIYCLWTLLVLGIVPFPAIVESYGRGEEATAPLNMVLGSSSVGLFAQGFAFFAIVTSFLAQGLTLTHFLADGFKKNLNKNNTVGFCLLALVPPLLFALYDPSVFFEALNFAGGICAMILFGVLPVLMSWVGRYRRSLVSTYRVEGGKVSLIAALLFSLFVIGCELYRCLS